MSVEKSHQRAAGTRIEDVRHASIRRSYATGCYSPTSTRTCTKRGLTCHRRTLITAALKVLKNPHRTHRPGFLANKRVESRTGASGVSLPVAHDAAFARVASVRLGLALFPVPAHRTEQARFAHSALVESVTKSPTESWSSAYSAERAQGSDVARLPDTVWSPAIVACAWHTATGAAVDEHVGL